MSRETKSKKQLLKEMDELERRLEEAEETLRAIRNGEVDAIYVEGPEGDQIFTLKGADQTYRTLIEDMHQGAVTTTADGTILYSNKAFAGMIQAPHGLIVGSSIDQYVAPEKKPMFDALFQKGLKDRAEGEIAFQTGDDSPAPVYVSINAVFLEGEQVICIAVTDLTEQKRQEEIVKSERLSRAILEAAGEAVVVCDNDGRVIRANHAAQRLAENPVLLENFDDVFQLQMVTKNNSETAEPFPVSQVLEGDSLRGREVLLRKLNEEDLHFLLSASHLRGDESTIGCVLVLTDITELKRLETELEDEKEQLAVTLLSIGDGVIVTDLGGRITLMNQMAESITGWSQREALCQPLNEVFHIFNQKTREPCENPVEKVLETGRIVGLANDTVLLSRDGNERVIADSGSPIIRSDGNTIGVVLVFRDITEKLMLEDRLRQSQKMEAIGTLAGGIAHEFNNILGIIIGNNELAVDHIPEWNPARECIEEIRAASFRAKNVVRQILSFARKASIERKPIKISPILEDTLKLLRSSIPTTIDIRHEISCERDTVLADPTQINQILMNLCNNSAHAMREEGGLLEVTLQNVKLGVRNEELNLEPGNFVKLIVRDTGHGIDPKIMDRIFDPYFTTKGLADGTGMGLSVVQGIVNSYDGTITVKSEVGKGSVFEVLLPCIEAEVLEKIEKEEEMPTGDECILFVDDEEGLVRVYTIGLKSLGYDVVSFTDSLAALEAFQKNPEKFDLVITDMTMPHLRGDKLAKEMMEVRPDVPVILSTGYTERISEDEAKEIGIKALAMKPLIKKDLAKLVRRVLDERVFLGNGEHILLVDNNEVLLETYVRALTELGYHISPFQNPLRAQEAFEDKPDQFDLVITDLRMTEMSGFELAEKILQIRSDMPVILCSGYDEKIMEDEAKKIGIMATANKALSIKELSKIIYEALKK
jgi:PAS domain S-box-containing protein